MPLNPSKPTCQGNLKTCPEARGGCGYKYKKGDTKWQVGGSCPQCGFERRCPQPPRTGYEVCSVHGAGKGANVPGPRGYDPDHRRVFLPKNLAPTYDTALRDPDLRRYDRNLALQESMIVDSIRRISTGESGAAWKELGEKLPAFLDELNTNCRAYIQAENIIQTEGMNPETRQAMQQAISNLLRTASGPTPEYLMSIIKKGRMESAARVELMAWEEQQRKTKESDMRQQKDLKAMVAIDQFIRFAEAVAIAVQNRITDRAIIRAIGQDVQQLLTLPDGPTIELPINEDA